MCICVSVDYSDVIPYTNLLSSQFPPVDLSFGTLLTASAQRSGEYCRVLQVVKMDMIY